MPTAASGPVIGADTPRTTGAPSSMTIGISDPRITRDGSSAAFSPVPHAVTGNRRSTTRRKCYTTPDVLSLPLIATTRNADAQIARPRPHRTRGGQVDDARGTAICRRSTIRPVAPDSVICVTPAEAAAVSIPERAATTLGSRSQDPSTLHWPADGERAVPQRVTVRRPRRVRRPRDDLREHTSAPERLRLGLVEARLS